MRPVEVPSLARDPLRDLAHSMTEPVGLVLLQMMEIAGREFARLSARLLDSDLRDRPVVVLAGRGGSSGCAFIAARHLHNWGAWVQVLCADAPDSYTGAAQQQLAILQAIGAPLAWAEEGWELPPCDLILDALQEDIFLSGLFQSDNQGEEIAPAASHDMTRNLILLAGSSHAPILSLDAPTGLDTATGTMATHHIHAAATMALGLPSSALLVEPGRRAGDLYLADIGVPPMLYAALALDVPLLFEHDTIVALDVIDGRAYLAPSRRLMHDD